MKKKVILFDLDGTLIDSTEAILESFYYALNMNNYEQNVSDQQIKDQIGYPLDRMFQTITQIENVTKFVDSYKEHYAQIHTQKTILLPHAKEAVKLAYENATLGVVTTKTTHYSKILLESFGILEYFSVIIGRQEVQNPKPHPEPILKALQILQLEPNDKIFMIGDTKLDLIAAKSAGINSIAVTCGYGTKEELSQYSSVVVDDSLEAVKTILL
ncbi:MAG: HAD family hydrolase [Campylobacterales bacterium]|nr:HAD family hydrolase [Campylobacterales bacterium]